MSKLGRELYERLGVFAGHFAKVGKSLDGAIDTYNKAVGSFETRVLVTARKFPELGAGGDELPDVPPVERRRPARSSPPSSTRRCDETAASTRSIELPARGRRRSNAALTRLRRSAQPCSGGTERERRRHCV